MKKFYNTPELEVTELLAEDILTVSNDDEPGFNVNDEVIMDGDKLFGGN